MIPTASSARTRQRPPSFVIVRGSGTFSVPIRLTITGRGGHAKGPGHLLVAGALPVRPRSVRERVQLPRPRTVTTLQVTGRRQG
jgi:hypothetical protein